MLRWIPRRWLWDFIAWVKFFFSKPLKIERPKDGWKPIIPKPMFEAIPAVPVDKVMVCRARRYPGRRTKPAEHNVL